MSERNSALIRRWFDEVWNQGRAEAIDELYAPGCLSHGLGDEPMVGAEGFKPFYSRYRAAFPDMRIVVEDVVADGDMTAARFRVKGTHTGSALGIAPTGKRVDFTGMSMTRWKDGKIVEGWNNVDMAEMMKQIGAE